MRFPILALDHFFSDHGTVRAAALTYTTLLAIVPMLAFAFAILRGLGFADELFGILIHQLGPVFTPDIRNRLYSYVTNVNVKTLGATGLAAFLISAVLTLNTIEKCLNVIFEVHRQRPLVRKFTDYFSILFLTPLLLGITISATAVFQARDFLAPLSGYWILTGGAELLLKMVPMLASIILFALVIIVIPNTYVRLKPAAAGGIVGGVLWFFLQWAYVSFQIGVSRYEAIFGTLAQLPILMVWIYFAWCILIYSAELAALVGGRRIRLGDLEDTLDQCPPPEFALKIMAALATRAETRTPPWTLKNLANQLDTSPKILKTVVDRLQQKGLIAVAREGGGLLLPRSPAAISALEIVEATEGNFTHFDMTDNERLKALIDKIRNQRRDTLKNVTLENLRSAAYQNPPPRQA